MSHDEARPDPELPQQDLPQAAPDSPGRATPRINPFAAMRRASETRVLEKTAEAARGHAASARAPTSGAAPLPRQQVTSIPQPRVAPAAATVRPGVMPEERAAGPTLARGFEALALAHERFGKLPERRAASALGRAAPALPLRTEIIAEVKREAAVLKAMVHVNMVAGYYDLDGEQRAAIRQRLAALDGAGLGAMIGAYAYLATSVAQVTDGKAARRAALDGDPALRAFCTRLGTFDEVPDTANVVPLALPEAGLEPHC